jgi:hypothetical protein
LHDVTFLPVTAYLPATFIPILRTSCSIPSLLLKTPQEEQDENHYQDRSQNTARGIAPTFAMRPGRKGADEKEDEYDN